MKRRSIRRMSIPILALLAASVGQAAAADILQVSAVRFWSLSEATRVVIEVSGEFEYHSERAHNPERVFFDILRARPRIEGRRIYSPDVNDKVVKRVRVAETLPGVTRVVLDLGNAADYSATQLSNPDRLVMELRTPVPVAPVAPVVALLQPPSVTPPSPLPSASVAAAALPPP